MDEFYRRILEAQKMIGPYINKTTMDHSTTFSKVSPSPRGG